MAVQIKIPDPLSKRINKNFLITSSAIQSYKGITAGIIMPDSATEDIVNTSYLGTPVIDNLQISNGSYTDLEDNLIEYSGIIVDTVIFEVNLIKNVVKTAIQGRNGTIKEYVSDGDYQITCRGVISNRDNVLPLDSVRTLRTLFEVPQQLPITSQFLNEIFDIFYVVIESYSIPQVEGKRNEVPFSFTATSDVPLDLEELE